MHKVKAYSPVDVVEAYQHLARQVAHYGQRDTSVVVLLDEGQQVVTQHLHGNRGSASTV